MDIGFPFSATRFLMCPTILDFNVMRKVKRYWLFLVFVSCCFTTCKDPYFPELEHRDLGSILIVEGFIDVLDTESVYQLGYAVPLDSSLTNQNGQSQNIPVLHAQLRIEAEDGQVYEANESDSSGRYVIPHPVLSPEGRYRLRIVTHQSEYVSDFVEAHVSPPIGQVTWQVENGGVQFNVSTTDPDNESHYYKWEVVETWKYLSRHPSIFIYDRALNTIRFREPDEMNSTCFTSAIVPDIHIATSGGRSSDAISAYPVHFVPEKSEKMRLRYSMLVRQYVISEAAYRYWAVVKENSENLGDIFGPMPAEIRGNIRSVDGTGNDRVVGFVEAAVAAQKRIFIGRNQLPPIWKWEYGDYYSDCGDREFETADAETFLANNPGFSVAYGYQRPDSSPEYTYFSVAPNRCVDCTLRGGSLQVPAFWQE